MAKKNELNLNIDGIKRVFFESASRFKIDLDTANSFFIAYSEVVSNDRSGKRKISDDVTKEAGFLVDLLSGILFFSDEIKVKNVANRIEIVKDLRKLTEKIYENPKSIYHQKFEEVKIENPFKILDIEKTSLALGGKFLAEFVNLLTCVANIERDYQLD